MRADILFRLFSASNGERNVGMAGLKRLDVRFASGQEVLSSYWGYLSNGGLIIDASARDLEVGDEVVLRVVIESADSDYLFHGQVVKHQPDGGLAVVAFHPGEPHDMLLTEALAETDDVPARRHRRYPVDLTAEVTEVGEAAPASAQVVNISEEGCCLAVADQHASRFAVGTAVSIRTTTFSAEGRVVWSRNRERGISFGDGEKSSRVSDYLRQL